MLTRFLYAAPPILPSKALPALPAALAQMLIQRAPATMIVVDMLVDAFMADRILAVPAHQAGDLLGAHLIPQMRLHLRLHQRGGLHPPPAGETAVLRLALCLFVPIAPLPAVAGGSPG